MDKQSKNPSDSPTIQVTPPTFPTPKLKTL